MNIVMISNYSRPEIFTQSITSLISNAADWSKHHLTVVYNGKGPWMEMPSVLLDSTIFLGNVGASRARNVGASSVPKYLRQNKVCFFDDDIFAVPGWDKSLEAVANFFPYGIISGHSHPYNSTIINDLQFAKTTTVISTVCFMMDWATWDNVGFFSEPGGSGGSEDVDYCKRAVEENPARKLVLTSPEVILHVGIHSSNGTPIVGSELVMERNRELERVHNIVGKVRYA